MHTTIPGICWVKIHENATNSIIHNLLLQMVYRMILVSNTRQTLYISFEKKEEQSNILIMWKQINTFNEIFRSTKINKKKIKKRT